MENANFADRIRNHYPQGLTAIFAIGATRRTTILELNRHLPNPGVLEDFGRMAAYLMQRYLDLAKMFFDLGGQNLIITVLSFRSFFERGKEYAEKASPELLRLIDDNSLAFYQNERIDPYFIGIDTLPLINIKGVDKVHQRLIEFGAKWPYSENNRKLIWEIASVPLYTFWKFAQNASPVERERIDRQILECGGINDIWNLLYHIHERSAYGFNIALPQFYLGTNTSGDLKWRSPMPVSLSGGDYVRMYYTPYPTLFITEEGLKTIMEDAAFGKRFHSRKTDYKDMYTTALAEAEYQRIMELRADPRNIVGLTRKVTDDED